MTWPPVTDPGHQFALQLDPAPHAQRIAGVDEAGRGPLAGPVTVAAVVLGPGRTPINGLDDSKQLTPQRREVLYQRIIERAQAWQVVTIEVEEIDRLNIYQATLLGMRRALEGLMPHPELARIDGNALPRGLPCPAEAWIGGDTRDRAIMAASILAKVTRDRMMAALHEQWPQYGFATHKGYGTPAHLDALARHGPGPHHRRSYTPGRHGLDAHLAAARADNGSPTVV
jgi:ribonuclease HII